jgi:hypothetical protein
MVWFGVGVVLLLYGLGRALGDPLAGLVAGAVGIASDLAQNAIPRARNDSPLVFFVLLALLLGVLGARRARHGGLPAAWAVAMGIALGLALESKLTATLSLAATIGWGGLVGLAAARRADRDPGTHLRAAWAAGRGWLAATLVAFAVLVVLNPHLWLNPLEHTAHLYVDRVEEMGALQMAYPLNAVYDVRERPVRVLLGSLVQGTWLGARRVPLEALLATVGFVTLAAKAARGWRLGRWPGTEGLLLTTVLTYFVGVSANLYVYWDTYLLPNLLLGAVLSGIGAHALISDPARGCVETIRARLARSSRRASESASPVGG